MSPAWVNDTVRGFGRQLGLETLALNDRGAAGINFENGMSLRLEHVAGAMVVVVKLGGTPSGDAIRAALAEAHPSASDGKGPEVRAACSSGTGEAFLAIRIGERDLSVGALEAAFRRLWDRAERLRRVVG
mgnify:CR=1 FL=1